MFYVNDEPEGKFLYTETIKLYCIVYNYKISQRQTENNMIQLQNRHTYCEFLDGDAFGENTKTLPVLVLLQDEVHNLLLQATGQVHLLCDRNLFTHSEHRFLASSSKLCQI